jgi:hypothetical protein
MHYWGISFAITNDMDKDNTVNFDWKLYHSDTNPNHLMNEVRFDDNKETAKGTLHYRPLYSKHKLFTRPYTQICLN